MNENNPLVSIIIPVYNGANFMREAIDSALAQTYPNIEVIVINDGSTDNGKTDRIAKSYGNKIRYFEKKNGGVSSALNLGIKKMKGTYFSWLSHDDVYLPEKVEEEINIITNHKEPSIVFSNFYLINDHGQTTTRTSFEKQFEAKLLEHDIYPAIRGCVNGDTILIHRDIFAKHGAFDEKLETSGDSDLWLRIFPYCKHYFIEKPLIKYRIHPNQDTQKHPRYQSQSDDIAVKKIQTIKKTHAKNWNVSLFRIYMDLYIQFKNANLPKSTKLAYELAQKYFQTEKPSFSIILPQTTKGTINTLTLSNFGDFEAFVHDDNLVPDDFRFHQLHLGNLTDEAFTKQAISKARGAYTIVLDANTDFHVDWLLEKYNYLRSVVKNNTPILIFEHTNISEVIVDRSKPKLLSKAKSIAKKSFTKGTHVAAKIKNLSLPKPTPKNTVFFSTATDDYIAYSAASLLSIRKYLPTAKLCIISRNISIENQQFLRSENIDFIDIDLRGKFNRHWQYPTECFYIFAGPELLSQYKYSVYIDGDILCCSNPLKNISPFTGVTGVAVGNCQGVFLNDYSALKQHFHMTDEQSTRQRIASGVVYFNNKSMQKINLLETASSLFKECLRYKIPRKGDDSLFTLIQLLRLSQNDIHYLPTTYNYMPPIFGKTLPKDLVFLHFAEYKPWNNYKYETKEIQSHIKHWLQIHNTNKPKRTPRQEYTIQQTSLYPKSKHDKNSSKHPLKIFVSENEHLGLFNFGDELPKDLIPAIFGYKIIPTTNIDEADLLSVGSVLFELPNIKNNKTLRCWGSGFISSESIRNESHYIKQVSFSAVRGTKTLKRIQKIYPHQKIALGDPGILANLIYPENSQKINKIGVVPHYIDADNETVEKLRQDSRFYIINPLDPPAKVASEISSCKYILSSSLHGLIFADSYGIPNAHINFSDKVYGGEYKFQDYDSAFDKKHLDLNIDKIFDTQYIEQLLQNYEPIKELEKHQKNLIDSFPY